MADQEHASEETHQNPAKMSQEKPPMPTQMAPTSHDHKPTDHRRAICIYIAIFLLLVGVTALTLWLIYRPYKPQFTVIGAAIYDLNVSSQPLLTTTMQFTIVTRNPNKRVSIYYDKLSAFVSYRSQAITPQVMLPPFFHETHSTIAFSPVMGGGAPVPVSMEVVNGLIMDEAYGVVSLRVVLLGRLRWKAGTIKTGHYGIYVKCDFLVGLKKGFVGQVPLLGSSVCKVDI